MIRPIFRTLSSAKKCVQMTVQDHIANVTSIIQAGDRSRLESYLDSDAVKTLSQTDRYSILLYSRSLTFDGVSLKRTWTEMLAAGVKPTHPMLRSLLSFHVSQGEMHEAEELLMNFPKYGINSLDKHMIVTLIAGWGRQGDLAKAEALFNSLNGNVDVATVTAIMSAYYQGGEYAKAIDVFERFKHIGHDKVLLKVLVKAHYKMGNVATAWTMWNEICKTMSCHDWLEIAKLITQREYRSVMAEEAVAVFSPSKSVAEIVSVAIDKLEEERPEPLFDKLVQSILKMGDTKKQAHIAYPLLSMIDYHERRGEADKVKALAGIHKTYQAHFSHRHNLKIISKLGR